MTRRPMPDWYHRIVADRHLDHFWQRMANKSPFDLASYQAMADKVLPELQAWGIVEERP